MRFQDVQSHQIEVKMSCYEIHIETVNDLLDPDNSQQQLMTNISKWRPVEIEVKKEADVKYLLDTAKNNRSVGSTALNEYSSRSHCIYRLSIER